MKELDRNAKTWLWVFDTKLLINSIRIILGKL